MDYTDSRVEFVPLSRGDTTFDMIVHSYYPNFITGNIPNFNERLQSLNYVSASYSQPSGSYIDPNNISYSVQNIRDDLQVFSITRDCYGEGILPGSFNVNISIYIPPVYDEDMNIIGGDYVQVYSGTDDSNGNIIIYDPDLVQNFYIGNIFYSQGLIIITNVDYMFDNTQSGDDFSFSFQNSLTIYEQTYRLRVKQHDFNYSYNPTLLDESGSLQSFSTTSSFQPYITSVGLYNEARELLAVAKFGQPVPMSANTDYNFNIKLDL